MIWRLPFVAVFLISLKLNASTVLFIGDSHSVGHFGMKLDKLLRGNYDQVQTIASCGSVAEWFFTGQKTRCGYYYRDLNGLLRHGNSAPTPKLTSALPKLKPESIIIALGANYTYASDSFMRSDIKRLLDHTETFTKNCLWVASPHKKKPRALTETIQNH